MDQMILQTCLYKKVRWCLFFWIANFLFLWTRCLVILSWGDGNKLMCASYSVEKEWGASWRFCSSFFKITCFEILFCKIIRSSLFTKSGEGRQSRILFLPYKNAQRLAWGTRDSIIAVIGNGAKSELAGVGRISILPLWVLEVRDFGSNRCPITAIMKKSRVL